jgi:AAA domain
VPDIDLLAVARGTVTAPAGCGKTHLIAEALTRHIGPKPILILTHTNAGVVALRGRLDHLSVPPRAYRVFTIDGWAMRLISTFPTRSAHDPAILDLMRPATDYIAIRDAAWKMLRAQHVSDVLRASYNRLIVDEVQDCSVRQLAIAFYAAHVVPTCVLGDPMQAIFDFGDKLAHWDEHVCKNFPIVGELTTPWRWRNAGTEQLGLWLLDVRHKLIAGEPVDLRIAPTDVTWIHLDGIDDERRRLSAARTAPPDGEGIVLIIEESTSPQRQRRVASQTPGAVTVERVDLVDLVEFANGLDFTAPDALHRIVTFAGTIMTNVGVADILARVVVLERNTGRRQVSDVEDAALAFKGTPCPRTAIELLVEIGRQGGVRTHRPAVLRACINALQACDGSPGNTFYDASLRAREQNRLLGRPLPKRAVGSTLLLKGLEADVSVVLNAADLNARNLYVALTRGSKKLVVCSPTPILNPRS